jgi:hypothetical protein
VSEVACFLMVARKLLYLPIGMQVNKFGGISHDTNKRSSA